MNPTLDIIPTARRMMRRPVLALAGAVLLLGVIITGLEMREPRELQLSRSLRIGMTRSEVELLLGRNPTVLRRPPHRTLLLYGNYGDTLFHLRSRYRSWLQRADIDSLNLNDWVGPGLVRRQRSCVPRRARRGGGAYTASHRRLRRKRWIAW